MAKQIIKLRVPAEPSAEYVSHGNLGVELVAGETVEVTDRRFADWLIDQHGLEQLDVVDVDPDPEPASEAGYPDDFPGRAALVAAEVPFDTAKNLSAEQLVGYPGIGEKTAQAIVAYFDEGGAE